MTRAAVLAPGYGGTAEQPILRALARRLNEFDIASRAITFICQEYEPPVSELPGGFNPMARSVRYG